MVLVIMVICQWLSCRLHGTAITMCCFVYAAYSHDHDRSFQGKLSSLKGRDVFLAPATLRPETMYGQTNCFVLPDGDYGAYEVYCSMLLYCTFRGMWWDGMEWKCALYCTVLSLMGWNRN